MKNLKLLELSDSETAPFLTSNGIDDCLNAYPPQRFRKRLQQLERCHSINMSLDKEQIAKAYNKYSDFFLELRNLLLGCHFFKHQKKYLKFNDDTWIDVKWIKNPYRCVPEYRSCKDKSLNHYLAHYKGLIQTLSRKEVQNFQLTFKKFFKAMDISEWLYMLDQWEKGIRKGENINEYMGIECSQYFNALSKLYEAALLAKSWADYSYFPPNHHLWSVQLKSFYDGYAAANPLDNLCYLFQDIDTTTIMHTIQALYLNYQSEKIRVYTDLNDFRSVVKRAIEVGWLLLQTNYYPDNWLNPDALDWINCPVSEEELDRWRPKYVTSEEQKNLPLTLSKLYYGLDIRDFIFDFEGRLIDYLSLKKLLKYEHTHHKIGITLFKIVEVLTLITIDLCKRKTDKEKIQYR